MAERLAYLEAVVGADITEFRKSMRDIRNDVGILSETISGIGGAARTMTFAFTAPMVALGTYAVQAASGFDGAMRNINSILQLSESQFGRLEGTVLDFAKTTRAGVVPATEALYSIFSAGVTDQDKAMALWKESTKVAEAGLADLDQTTRAMTATMAAYNLNTGDATRIGNVWTQMVKIGVGSMGEFLSNAQKILPASANLGVSLEDMGATIAYLSQVGGGAAKAETAYSQVLTNLLKPTIAATDAFKKLGVATGSELIAKFGSVGKAVQALAGVSDEISFAKMFSKTGLEGANILKNNVEGLTKAVADFNENLDGATMSAWEQQSKSFAFQWDLMKTSLEAVAVTIGQVIIPLIVPVVQGFSGLLQKITEVNPELVQLGVIFVGVVAAAAPLIWLLTSMLTPIGLIVGGVTTLAAAVGTNFDGIRTKILSVVQDITGGLKPLKDTFDEFMAHLFPKAEEIPNSNSPIAVDVTKRITVTKPKSLWQIYTDEGYAEQFSWDEFMKEAKAGGWKGGVVNIGDEITITGGDKIGQGQGEQFRDSFQNVMHDTFGGMSGQNADSKATETQLTIFDRLKDAIDAAWPKLKTALDDMWANFKDWVKNTAIKEIDKAGGDVLNAMAGWFKGNPGVMGNTAMYTQLTDVFTTDVGGAAKDAASTFENTFPQLTSGLKTLFNNVSNWIMVEGVPTVARGIGFVAGRMASLLRDAIGMVWQKLGGASGAAAQGQQVATAIDMSIFRPLSEGVQEGIGENDGNIFDTFMDNLGAALLLAAGTWVVAPSLVSAVAKPIIGLVGSALTSAIASSALGTGITTFVTSLGLTMTAALGALSIIGIGAIIVAALLSNEDIANGLKAWTGVWDNFKLIVALAVADITTRLNDMGRDLGTTIADIQAKWAAARLVINPNDVQAKIDLANAVMTIQVNDLSKKLEDTVNGYLAGEPIDVNIPGLLATISGANGSDAMIALQGQITDPVHLGQAVTKAILGNDQAALSVLIPVLLSYEGAQNGKGSVSVDQIAQTLLNDTGLSPKQIGDMLTIYYANNPTMLEQIKVSLQKLTITPTPTTTVDTTAIDDDDWISRTIGNKAGGRTSTTVPVDVTPVIGGVDTATTTWADTLVDTMPAKVQAAVAANSGNMDAAADSLTKPFVDAFTTAFAPDTGTVTVQWKDFLTGFVTDVNTLQTTTDTTMPKVQSAVVTAVDTMKNSVLQLNDELTKSAEKINALVTNSPYTIKVKIETEGAMPAVPAGATGGGGQNGGEGSAIGLNRVPYDNFLIRAHKGEQLLTKSEADDYKSLKSLPSGSDNVEVDQSSPTFIVNGVQDFDQFLREAKRRGFNLDKYRR